MLRHGFPAEIEALLQLVQSGFRAFTVGDPQNPDALVYVRACGDSRDMVRVTGPDQCEAIRMVAQSMTRQIEGCAPSVVAAVLSWSRLDARAG